MTNRDEKHIEINSKMSINESLENLSEFVVILDFKGSIRYANNRLLKKIGLKKDDVLEHSFFNTLISKNIEPQMREHFNDLILKKTATNKCRNELTKSDGNKIFASWFLSILKIDEKEYVMCTGVGITDEFKAEENNILFTNVIERSLEAIIIVSLDSKILEWNDGAEKLLGFNRNEMIGKSFFEIIPKGKIDETKQCIEILHQNKYHNFQSVRLTKDNQIINVAISANLITDTNGKPIAISSFLRDMGDFLKQEDELKYHVAVLEDKNRALTILEKIVVSRELKMLELKNEILNLKRALAKETDPNTE